MKRVLTCLALGLAFAASASPAFARPVVAVSVGVVPPHAARLVVAHPARVRVPGYWRWNGAHRVWVRGYWTHGPYRAVRRVGGPVWRVRAGYRVW